MNIATIATLIGVGVLSVVGFNTATKPTNQIETTLSLPASTLQEVVAPIAPTLELKTLPLTAKKLDLDHSNVTFLVSEVTDQSVDIIINDINSFNSKSSAPIYLVIDSPGGSVLAGSKLISVIEASNSKVKCVVTGLAASMAFHILQHCDERLGTKDAFIMSHPASVGVMYQGELEKLVSRFTFLQTYVSKMEHHASKRAGMKYEDFKLRSSVEMWLDTEDAINLHFMDKLVAVTLPSVSEVLQNPSSNKIKELTWFE